MDKYFTYFLDIIESDACPMIHSSYAAPFAAKTPLVDPTLCSTISNGVLSKGLAVAFRNIYSKIYVIVTNYIANRG